MTVMPDRLESPCDAWFVQLVTEHQRMLYLHILALVPKQSDAEEILQETNLLIWRKRSQFVQGTSFKAWAFQVAYLMVLKYRSNFQKQVKLFSDGLIEVLAAESVDRSDQSVARQRALEHCLGKLHATDNAIITMRYRQSLNVTDIAEKLVRPANSVYQSLSRIRKSLATCILRRLSREESV
jgi:RNA polymerase sigma-70 factor, ECF subfamily